jgi:hypothetical protein
MQGKLNLFQAMMLRWRELYPYNAVHVVVVDQPLEPARLKTQIASELQSAGLTGLVLDRRRRRFEYRGGAAVVDVTILPGGEDARGAAEREIERQLNLSFPRDGALQPFRFFAVDGGASFHLGLAYDHFVAGGDSIAVLLARLVARYRLDGASTAAWTPQLYPSTYRRLFLRHAGAAWRGLRRLPALAASCRRSCRAPCRLDAHAGCGFLSRRVAASGCASLSRAARDWGVTRNDLFLAILLLALAKVLPQRSAAHRRRELAVAAIVNVRHEFEADAAATFGQFLASLHFSHPVPPAIELRQLAQAVGAETRRIKSEKLYLQTLLALAWAGFVWRFLKPDRRRGFLAKHYPIWAGITGLNVDALWRASATGAEAPECLRAVPTGPLAPLVFAITTSGGVIQLGVSYRRADVNLEFADEVATEFVRHVDGLARFGGAAAAPIAPPERTAECSSGSSRPGAR